MFRFTIRELVLMTVIAAMGCAWWTDRGAYRKSVAVWKLRAVEASDLMNQTGWKVTWKDNGAMYEGHGQKVDVGF